MINLSLISTTIIISLLSLVFYLITHPEVVERWYSILCKLVSGISERAERGYISSDIQSRINSFAKQINSEAENLLPHSIKIEWSKVEDRESFVKSGEVVIVMRHHKNQAKNMLYAVLEYIQKGLIPSSREYIDKKVLKSSDLYMIRKMLFTQKLYDSLQIFNEEVLEKEMINDIEIGKFFEIMGKLDKRGLFTRVLLNEFSRISTKLYPAPPTQDVFYETREFTKELEKVATKERGKDVSPSFAGKTIRTSMVLIGRPEVVGYKGAEPYISFIEKCKDEDFHSVYILAIGKINSTVAEHVAKHFKQFEDVEVGEKQEFNIKFDDGKVGKSICFELKFKK